MCQSEHDDARSWRETQPCNVPETSLEKDSKTRKCWRRRLADWCIDKLIEHASQSPYLHLDGYMERYWLVPEDSVTWRRRPITKMFQFFGIAIRLHHILRSDDDRHFHDHPWNFTSLILRGGYTEVSPFFDSQGCWVGTRRQYYSPGSLIRRKCTDWHYLLLPEKSTCWTLFITHQWKQTWGFLVDGKKIPHQQYIKDAQSWIS